MYEPAFETEYLRDVELAKKRGKDMEKLKEVIGLILKGKPLPKKHCNHKLVGDWTGYWECHITADWLLVYKKYEKEKIIYFVRTGSHSDLF